MTLLSNFYSRIYGSVEYLASESLLFILNKSLLARETLANYIKELTYTQYSNLHYMSQSVGSEKERPDISGFDENYIEKVIIETKFWASLTDNQPMTYLKRIQEHGGLLLFICPSLRKISLFNEISYILTSEDDSYEKDSKNYCFKNRNETSIYVLTWDQVLLNLKTHFIENNENNTLSDIEQLMGLCEKIDTDSFLPLQKSDLSPEIPRRIMSYYRIVDKIIDKLSSEICLSTRNLKTTPQKWGYRRYAQIDNFTIALDVNLECWGNLCDTPLWIQISQEWKGSDIVNRIGKKVEMQFKIEDKRFENNLPYFPIYIECNQTEDKVIENSCETIKKIYSFYQEFVSIA